MSKMVQILFSIMFHCASFHLISSEIVLEDDFNELNETKWQVIGYKHRCERKYKYDDSIFEIQYDIQIIRAFSITNNTLYDK